MTPDGERPVETGEVPATNGDRVRSRELEIVLEEIRRTTTSVGRIAGALGRRSALFLGTPKRSLTGPDRPTDCSENSPRPAAAHGNRLGGGPSTGDPENAFLSARFSHINGIVATSDTVPGARLRAIAVKLFDADTVEFVCDPAIADLQFEYAQAAARGMVSHELASLRLRHVMGVLVQFALLILRLPLRRLARTCRRRGASS